MREGTDIDQPIFIYQEVTIGDKEDGPRGRPVIEEHATIRQLTGTGRTYCISLVERIKGEWQC